jgi:hypothetical protein
LRKVTIKKEGRKPLLDAFQLDGNNINNNNIIELFIYLHAELNYQWLITESK